MFNAHPCGRRLSASEPTYLGGDGVPQVSSGQKSRVTAATTTATAVTYLGLTERLPHSRAPR